MRGIRQSIGLKWNENDLLFNPGIRSNDIFSSGVSVGVPINESYQSEKYGFSFSIDLNGSEQLNFIPLGRETKVSLASGWDSPSLDGAFLPTERQIKKDGFNAKWKILNLNRNYPQEWLGNGFDIYGSVFGVRLLLPVDSYHKTTRSVKYAVMFISLTFLVFFFVEVFNGKRIHPVQYLLVGLALCVFYTLLLSLSEHIGFGFAYLISSVATVVLITAYSRMILGRNISTLVMGAVLTSLYLFLYVLLQVQDYALLIGSVGLFVIMAIIMYLSTKINWYSDGDDKPEKA